MYDWLADLLVAIHVAYVAFVVVGLLLILLGTWRGWTWVRNPIFRVVHLMAILIVAGEALLDIPCPLTVWEKQLRDAAGQPTTGESFIGRLLHRVIFYELPITVLTTCYVAFAALVAFSFWLVPPRWRRSTT